MLLLFAIISVFLALMFYAVSILQEFAKKEISLKILILFWLGFVFDLAGTLLMSMISEGLSFNFHALAGLSALVLMGVKAAWSTINYKQGLGKRIPSLYTIAAAAIWMAVFIAGFFADR
ncbi:MAG: TIGR03987 family protein [Candidatus Moranbacteria bacterium]|nr:TIGR03987 family protein [Candidatus Moranbacteria bacterium]